MSLEVKDLSKKYGEKTVVNHISLKIDSPSVFALLGTNGAGKTTTIRMILECSQEIQERYYGKESPLIQWQ